MTDYLTHPLIREHSIERRAYQLAIAMRALDGNTLVVIPTGLGKTAIALLTTASRLYNKKGKVLMLAPTKPLVEQHLRYFKDHLILGQDKPGQEKIKNENGMQYESFVMFTGEAQPEKRTQAWNQATICFATPQVIKNDVIAGRYSLSDVILLIFDEGHRAVGNYSYVFLASRYMETAKNPLILAMTASPGGNREKITDICENLCVSIVETRVESDPDVRPYVFEREVTFLHVTLPADIRQAVDLLSSMLDARLGELKTMGYDVPKRENLSMKVLNQLNGAIQFKIAQRDSDGFIAASIHAECMKIRHAVSLGESQGCLVLRGYLEKLYADGTSPGGTKAAKRIAEDPLFQKVMETSLEWSEECHPKLLALPDIIQNELERDNECRIIIFATYRDTVSQIVHILEQKGISAGRFVGQATKDREKGLSQKKQIEALRQFREGLFRVLVATSVGEEGLDIPSTDLVIFFEPVPSEIRSIQRKGRTGRHGTGRILVLVTKDTSDETFRFVSSNREKAMVREIKGMQKRHGSQQPLFTTPDKSGSHSDADLGMGPKILVDDRETMSRVAEELSNHGAQIQLKRLPYGDYQIGDRIIIERKTTRDFVDTLIERDLLGQIHAMSQHVTRPVLIIEGEDLYGLRDIHPNAIRGALAAIAIDMGVTILYTHSAQETAAMIYVIARREGREERTGGGMWNQKKYCSDTEAKEHIIGSLPDIGLLYAKRLLQEFGSVRGVITAEQDQLMKVKGIGSGKAERIFDLVNTLYE